LTEICGREIQSDEIKKRVLRWQTNQ